MNFSVRKALKQYWNKSKYSYLTTPRPDFGLMLILSGSVDFVTEAGTVSARAGNAIFLPKHSHYEAHFGGDVEDYLVCFDDWTQFNVDFV